MGEADPPAVAETPRRQMPKGLADPYLHLALNGVLVAGAEVLLKYGATATAQTPAPAWVAWLGVTALGSAWVWAGVVVYIASFVNWLHILRWLPLSVAFPVAAVVHALVPLAAWAVLGEPIGLTRWGGIGLIMLGICFIAAPAAKAEEAL